MLTLVNIQLYSTGHNNETYTVYMYEHDEESWPFYNHIFLYQWFTRISKNINNFSKVIRFVVA